MDNIDMTNGRANIAFMGDRNDIWHRLGAQMPADASIDTWAKQAGLNWTAAKVPALADLACIRLTNPPPGKMAICDQIRADGRYFMVRSDNGHILSPQTVSDIYKPVQPAEVLDWFDRYIQVDDRFALDVAGSLKQGEIIWATATYRDASTVAGEAHIARLLMTTTFDGTGATINKATMVRVVCNNTLDAALADGGKSVIRTRHNTTFNAKAVGNELATIAQGFEAYKAMGEAMSMVETSAADVSKFFKACLEIDFDAKSSEISGRKRAAFDKLSAAWSVSRRERNESKDHASAWTALQAVTRYVDHDKNVRAGAGDVDEARLHSAQFGSGAQLKARAVGILTGMAREGAFTTLQPAVETEDAFKTWLGSHVLRSTAHA